MGRMGVQPIVTEVGVLVGVTPGRRTLLEGIDIHPRWIHKQDRVASAVAVRVLPGNWRGTPTHKPPRHRIVPPRAEVVLLEVGVVVVAKAADIFGRVRGAAAAGNDPAERLVKVAIAHRLRGIGQPVG